MIFWQIYYFFNTYKLIGGLNAWKYRQTCYYIELSEYKLYMGHIHTLVLTREWIAMLAPTLNSTSNNISLAYRVTEWSRYFLFITG